MLTPEQQEFISLHNCKLVVEAGDDSLYRTPIGVHTVYGAMHIYELHRRYREALRAKRPNDPRLWDDELTKRSEQMINDDTSGAF